MNEPQPEPLPILRLDAQPLAGVLLVHGGAPLIRRLEVRNAGHLAWQQVIVRLTAEPEGWMPPHELRLDGLAPLAHHVLHDLTPPLSLASLAAVEERTKARLTARVFADGEQVAEIHHALELLPPQVWPGIGVLPELLAAWVRPNSRALPPILKSAAAALKEATGSDALSGYQARDPRQVWRMAQAVWEAVAASGISYINPPASFEASGQRIRSHEEVLGDQLGTCLDLAVLLAALLEQCGLHPLILVQQGHAFVGVWLTEFQLHEPVIDDPLPVRKRVELGEALVFDSSPVASGGTFEAARLAAERLLHDVDLFRLALDVRAARQWGVRPLPLPGEAALPPPPQPGQASRADNTLPERWADDQALPTTARDRIDRWASRLLDLSLRNRLLAFREGKATIPFVTQRAGSVEDALAQGGLQLRARPELRSLGEGDDARLRLGVLADEAVDQAVLFADLLEDELGRRLTELYRSSRTALQESGANTLYLTIGMLRWYESPASTQPRHAPLLVVPVQLERGTAGRPWRLLPVDDEARINITLLEKLRADFGLEQPGLGEVPTDDHGVDVPRVLRRFRELVKDQARWEVLDSLWLGQLSFTKFLMWLDLQAKRSALIANPVVQHLFKQGGQPLALASALVEESSLDVARPTRQTLTVLDADPSQLQAILAAIDGSSFVLQGPPGTGKSQTITNLIGRLLDEGRTVLFVSEKMAALDVVHDRLRRVGLGPFCLELHSPTASRRAVMEQIRETFTWADSKPPGGWQEQLRKLSESRDALNEHAARLATPSPFGVPARDVLGSLFDLQARPALPLQLNPLALIPAQVETLRETTHALVVGLSDVGELQDHPWRGVGQSSWSPAWAEDALAAVATLHQQVRTLRAAADDFRAALDLGALGDGRDDLLLLDEVAALLRDAPVLPPDLIARTGTPHRVQRLRAWATAGRAALARREALLSRWRPELLHLDLPALSKQFHAWAEAFFLFAWILLFSARRQLRQVALQPLPANPAMRDELDEASALNNELASIEALSAEAGPWLGPLWRGIETPWDEVHTLADQAERLHRLAMRLADRTDRLDAADKIAHLCSDGAELLAPGSRTAGSPPTCRPGAPGDRPAIGWCASSSSTPSRPGVPTNTSIASSPGWTAPRTPAHACAPGAARWARSPRRASSASARSSRP